MNFKFRHTGEDTVEFKVDECMPYFWHRYANPRHQDEKATNRTNEFSDLNEVQRELANSILCIPGVAEIVFSSFRLDVTKSSGARWLEIMPRVESLITGYHDPKARKHKVKERVMTQLKKEYVAKQITKGLPLIKEDHDVFVSSADGSSEQICGCVLMIAVAGKWGGDVDSALRIERQISNGISGVELCASALEIPTDFAEKLDHLHRVERMSAIDIAHQLCLGNI